MPPRPLNRPALLFVAVLLAELCVLYPGALFRGEVITSSALAYGMQPWKGRLPAAERPPRANPVLSDDLVLFTPWDRASREAIHGGSMPFWNGASGCGMPLLANNQSAVLAPTHGLRWIWDSPRARSAGLLIELLLAGLGMVFLMSRWGAGGWGACIAGLAWVNGAVMTSWMMYPLSGTAAWLSWLLLGLSDLLGLPGGDGGPPPPRRGGVVTALALGAMLLSGHLPTAAQLLACVGVGIVLTVLFDPVARRRLHTLPVPLLSGVLIGMPQIVPTLVYMTGSQARTDRGGDVPAAAAHLPLEAAWSWLVPRGFGSPELFGYWGAINFNEAVATVGIAPLILALLAVALVPCRPVRALALLVAVCAALAHGLPPLPSIVSRIPVLEWCAGQRWIVPAQWGMAALAGFGAGALGGIPRRRLVVAGTVLAAVLLTCVSLHPSLHGSFEAGTVGEARLTLAARAVLIAAVEVLAAGLLVGLAASGRVGTGLVGLAGLTAASGLMLGWNFNPAIPVHVLPAPNDLTRGISEQAGGGRVLPVGWVLRPNTGVLAGVPTLTGQDDLMPRRLALLTDAIGTDGLERSGELSAHGARLAARSAVRLVVADRPLAGAGLRGVPSLQGPSLWAAELTAAHPMLGLYDRSIPAADPDEAFDRLGAGRVDGGTVVIEGAGAPEGIAMGETAVSSWRAAPFRRDGPNRITATVTARRPSWLVFREAALPGWRVGVDGVTRPWRVADGMFLAVFLDAGRHEVEFLYRAPGWELALALAAIGAVGVLWSLARSRRLMRSAPPAPRFPRAE